MSFLPNRGFLWEKKLSFDGIERTGKGEGDRGAFGASVKLEIFQSLKKKFAKRIIGLLGSIFANCII